MGSKPVDWPAVSAAAGRLQQAWSADSWSWYHWCPVGVQWCSDNLLVAIKQAAGDAPIQIHMLETRYQQTYGQRKFGSTLVAHLAELGFLNKNVACAHSVWLTDNDIRLLADYQAMVIHNPSSNMRLRSGLCRVLDLLDAGVRVGIGLDGAGLNDDQDLFLEMRLVKGLAYEPGIDKRSLSARQVLSMATLNAADIVGGPRPKRGKLLAGFAADLVTLKVERILSPYIDERADLVDVIFRRAGSGDVDTVVVNGELQMRAGKHLWKDVIAVADALKDQLSQPKGEGQQRQEQLAAELLPHLKALYSDW
jgi:cytosine/adenosine deaminase-related metal-dependent hydrolase